MGTPNMMVATNADREIRLQAIRAKIRSLEEADVKQTQLLNFLHSDDFRDQVSNKILNMTRGHLVDGFGEKQNESQESRIEKLKEEREVLLEEENSKNIHPCPGGF